MIRLRAELFVLCLLASSLTAQPLVKSAIQVDPGNTKQTGASFGYRLTYNCSNTSGPCLNSEVVDLLPAEVQRLSTVPASPTGDVAAINVTNNYLGSGRTRVQFVMISPLPAGNSGDLIINVEFPNGSTPDGTVATNTADGINLETSPGTFTTPPVAVTAVATEQASLQKTLTSSPANLDLPETYRLRISNSGSDGTLNLTSIGPITDTLHPGTVFNGATPAADCEPGCVGTTPATVTWTSPCSVPLTPGNNCNITVNVMFPSGTFPSGTSITNTFTADGTPLGEPPQSLGVDDVTHQVTTFVANASATLQKNITSSSPNPPTLNQTFSYELIPSNDGNVPLDNMTVIDALPIEMQVSSVTTGAYNNATDFAAGEGVRVSYEKNSALGVFTLWGSSPNTTTNTTLTAPPPGLGAGEYITRIRWEYGQAAVGMTPSGNPRITGQIINPDNAGGPVAFGDSIQNCATLAAVHTAGPTNVNENTCRAFTLSGPFVQLNPAKENLSGGGPFNPGQAVSWRLHVRSASQSSDPVPLEDVKVADLLPIDLLFTGWTFDDNGTGLPAPQNFSQIPNYAGTGRTLLRWSWNAGSGSLGTNAEVHININTTIRNGAQFGSLSNAMTLDSDSPGLSQRCSGSSQVDSLDFDGDGDSAETVCVGTGSSTVAGIAQLISSKTIKGTCDGGAVSSSAGTLTGGGIEYHLRVQNVGTVPMQNFVLIDILPFVGDTGVRDTNPRGSQWSPLLAAPITPPSGTTLYYSTSGNPCRGEVGGPTSSCDPPNWTTVVPTPITSVRSFKLEFGNRVVNPFDFIEFTFVMTTPGNVPPAATAYNSFAYQADRADGLGSLAAEPVKVGINIGSCDAASLGDFVWIDTNDDGIQNDGTTGLNGVPVTLLAPGTDGLPGTIDDIPLASAITSNSPGGAPGWYTFPGLAPGTYFVHITRPPTYDIASRDTTADSNDSDADVNDNSQVVTLAVNENNPTVDFGLVATALAAAGDYVWFDLDNDGVQNEPVTSGVNGVTVHLYVDDGDGNPEPGGDDVMVATTVTTDDDNARPGYYLFDQLTPGVSYFMQFIQPPASTGFTTRDAGANDGEDSDANPTDGTTATFILAPNEVNRTWDAGLVGPTGTLALGDQVWFDSDNDGVFEPENGELGIDDVRLDLYLDVNGDGDPSLGEQVSTSVTATSGGFAGRYRFDGLAAGNYIVVVSPSNFSGGGALSGMQTSNGNDPAPDPDDDVNGDDNGTNLGALIVSRAVTLSDNGEPTAEDGNNDTNLTVDFGFINGATTVVYDYGDAPDVISGTATADYRTTALDIGPRHLLGVSNAPYLGACVDSDGGFNQNIGATADDTTGGGPIGTCSGNDDEDGVTFTGSVTPGATATFDVTSGGPTPCLLDAWVDWNQSGDFDGSEQIAVSLNVPNGPATVLTPAVPAGAIPGTTYARFRCSSFGSLSPYGDAADGEVEDYAVTVLGEDHGDAPASYGDAEHTIDPSATKYLGTCVDTESASQSSAGADGDDVNVGTSRIGPCVDDENGVLLTGPLATCTNSSFTLTASAASRLDAWIDFNLNGTFDVGEQIFTNTGISAGTNVLIFAVPCSATPGATYARFRVSSVGGLTPTGIASDGEVEDYVFTLAGSDFGDAPDTYGTLFASNGASHIIVTGYSLGASVDNESDGQPNAAANGDGADEDGVTLPTAIACAVQNYTVNLTNTAGLSSPQLDAWIDWDGDGAFDDPRDRIAGNVPLVSGVNNLSFTTPCNVTTRSTYARFRLSNTGLASPTGNALNGEVEDYVAVVEGYDFGDAPAPHPTLSTDNGARHVVLLANNPSLAGAPDQETDGQPNAASTGDDANGIDDENGVTIGPIVAGASNSIDLTAGATGGFVSCWMDFDNNGVYTDLGEQIVANAGVVANTTANRTFIVPATSARNVSLRCRISTAGGLTSVGAADDGEVEDYLVPIDAYDLGDAPTPYPTLIADSGARHAILPTNNPTLGATVDADADGHPTAGFDGDDLNTSDDEDGVTFSGTLLPSTTASIDLSTGATGGNVSCWVDFNRDNDWTDPGEQIVTDLALGASATASPTFSVPAAASMGTTGVRCRISTLTGLTPSGDAINGEVEDNAVIIGTVDFGDAPDTYGTTIAANGPRHGVVTGFYLGATIDAEAQGQPSVGATGDGADEDGVVLPITLNACASTSATVTLTNTAAIATPLLDAWVDFDGNGTFDDPGDRIATSVALTAGANVVNFNVPCGAISSASYARFRLTSTGVSAPTGSADDGEIEDYAITVLGLDFGDAADPTYPTLLASNGARHFVLLANNPTLGPTVDTEANGAPSAGATGDDTNGSDDEDGVTFSGDFAPGGTGQVIVSTGATGGFVNVWIDFNGNGSWGDAGEQIVVDQTLGANATQGFSTIVPLGVTLGNAVVRTRISSQAGLGVTGSAPDGEIEDHIVPLVAEDPILGVALQLVAANFSGSCGVYDPLFEVRLSNLGNVPLTNVQATTDLASVFVPPATFSVTSITSTDLAVDPTYNGGSNSTMLLPGATLTPGQTAVISFTVHLATTCADTTYNLSTTGTGTSPSGTPVTDVSQNGDDPDPNDDGDSSDNGQPTPLVITATVGIPTLDEWALIAVALLLAALAIRKLS